jgi:hypothetical protein
MAELIINKVAGSGLITIDLEDYFSEEEIGVLDIKPYLFKGLILKEKEFREGLQKSDWAKYENKIVAIICSAEAIIPVWAYMLIATYLQPVALDIIIGSQQQAALERLLKKIKEINIEDFREKRLIIKGCGDKPIDAAAYLEITKRLMPVAKSIMYGEACSNVPVYKKK